MIRVISSPSSSTTGLVTLIFAMPTAPLSLNSTSVLYFRTRPAPPPRRSPSDAQPYATPGPGPGGQRPGHLQDAGHTAGVVVGARALGHRVPVRADLQPPQVRLGAGQLHDEAALVRLGAVPFDPDLVPGSGELMGHVRQRRADRPRVRMVPRPERGQHIDVPVQRLS